MHKENGHTVVSTTEARQAEPRGIFVILTASLLLAVMAGLGLAVYFSGAPATPV